MCPRGPVVPAWLGVGVPGSRIGGPGAPFGVPAWSRGPVGPVVPSGLSLSSSLFAVWGPRSGIIICLAVTFLVSIALITVVVGCSNISSIVVVGGSV